MKRIPIILAALTALLLVICSLEYGFRGLNPDVDSDWVSHPAWWQSDTLADFGFLIRWTAVMAYVPFESLGENLYAIRVFELLIIGIATIVVFYLAKSLVYLRELP